MEETKAVEPTEAKLQIVMPTSEEMRKLGIKLEIDNTKPTVHAKANENFYTASLGPTIGKAIFEVVAGRNRSRVKAFQNKDFQIFFESIYRFVQRRAHDMGYFYEDVQFSKNSGITRDGTLLLKIEPKPGARRLL